MVSCCRSDKVLLLLKDHILAMTSRVNTLTGVAYKDDPTIMGYNLFNEPRYVRAALLHCCTGGQLSWVHMAGLRPGLTVTWYQQLVGKPTRQDAPPASGC